MCVTTIILYKNKLMVKQLYYMWIQNISVKQGGKKGKDLMQ